MTTKYKKMSNADIVETLERIVDRSVGFNDNRLSQERITINKYYAGELPLANAKGRSKFVSQDVFDAVESMKAALLETFASGNDIGQFEPRTAKEVDHTRLAAAYCDYVIFEQNDIFNVWSDQIHDGLLARIGVAKVRWDKKFVDGDEEFEDVNEVALAALLGEPGVELKDVEQKTAPDGVTVLYSGTITRSEDCSRVKIGVLPPETFFVENRAENIYDSAMGDRQRMSRSDLRDRGISEATIAMIGDKDDKIWQVDQEVTERFEESGQSSFTMMEAPQDQVEKVWVYEVYTELDIEGTGSAKLYRFMYAGKVLLEKEVVRCKPYLIFAPLRIPHKVHGDNYSKRLIPTQNANTMLTRGILDHTAITNNPRMTVLKGSVNDARELIDNRYGGIVNINRPDGVKALEQPPLNPYIFQTMQVLDYKFEGTSSVSKLSQGLNKDAVSKQNSQALVEQLTSMSMQRQKIIARRFANDVVKKLYELVYDIVRENEKRARIIQIAGQWVEVNPADWPYGSRPFRVQLALGYGEKERQANEWLGFHQQMSSDPSMTQQYTPTEKFNVLKRVADAKGIKDIQNYIKPPDQVQQPQPDPMEVRKLDLAEREIAVKEAQTQVLGKQAGFDFILGQQKNATNAMKVEGDHAIKADAADLKERAQAHKEQTDEAELKLEEKALNQKNLKGVAAV